MARVRLDLAIEEEAKNGTLAAVCEAHGLPAKYAADLSRIRRGEHVRPERYRAIGRALGVIPPARKVRRVTLASIPLDAIARCARIASLHSDIPECAEAAAAVTRWLERVEGRDDDG